MVNLLYYTSANFPENLIMTSTNTKEKLKGLFVDRISSLLQLNHFKGTTLYRFLQHHAKKWQNDHIDIHEVLVEGVRRGIEHIDNTGEKIRSPEAWLRITCLNILKDAVKHTVRDEKKVENVSLVQSLIDSSLPKPELLEQLEYLDKALELLSEDDRRLIFLRFFERKRYEDIQQDLLIYYDEEVSLQALRKRESRALQRLKQYFFTLYDGESKRSI